ncbi:TolC family outer membrane protein [Bosea thiooxidans]
MSRRVVLGIFLASVLSAPAGAQSLSLVQAIRLATSTNPAVGEAQANKRASAFELRQAQGGLLPQVRLQADIGPERQRQFDSPVVSLKSNDVANGRQANLVVRQVLFDGFQTINETWRQAARVDAASWRVQERSELIALDAIQAYTDIVRLQDMIAQSNRNIAVHRQLLSEVQARFDGGRAGSGDLDQVRERVAAAEAAKAELEIRLGESVALFRKTVGAEPRGLSWPARPKGLPASRTEALNLTLRHNPTIRAAGADVNAAEAQRDVARGADLPTVALEASAAYGKDTQNYTGRYDDYSVKLSASWLLYSGGTISARQGETVERLGEQQMRLSLLQRQAVESIDRAWAAQTGLASRIRALTTQVAAADKVVAAYRSEYDLGQRTLLDLLNSEQNRYNAAIGLINARGQVVFADYQLVAATGTLLKFLNIALPPEAANPLRGLRETGALMPPIGTPTVQLPPGGLK